MVSFFPKTRKSSASFSQSIRNRLHLKKLQAQAKNFCRVLDIRVSEVMYPDSLHASRFRTPVHFMVEIVFADREDPFVRPGAVKHL